MVKQLYAKTKVQVSMNIPKIMKRLNLKSMGAFVRFAILEYIDELKSLNEENLGELFVTALQGDIEFKTIINENVSMIPHPSFSELARVAIIRKIIKMRGKK